MNNDGIDGEKRLFIEYQFAVNAVAGALQRNKTYKKGADKSQKTAFRNDLMCKLRECGKKYFKPVNSDSHIKNIKELADCLSIAHKDTLEGKKARLGTAQKALNLYLKFLWCSGVIEPAPPHCPVDRIIITKLKIKFDSRTPSWTKIDTPEDYQKIIETISLNSGKLSPSEWEVKVWNAQSSLPEGFKHD